jgi:hypothetical protein
MFNDPAQSAEAIEILRQTQAIPWIEATLGVGFLAWIACYALIIRRGFVDKTCGMPLFALAVNFAWEVMWGFVIPDQPPMGAVNKAWAIVDLVIVAQFFAYMPRRMPSILPRPSFYPLSLLVFGFGLGVVILGSYEFKDWELGGGYIAYLDNFMMSMLFVGWALHRTDVDGQSLWIGVTKLLGTVAVSVAQFELNDAILGGSPFLNLLFVACAVADVVYIWLLWRRMKGLGIEQPWRRF